MTEPTADDKKRRAKKRAWSEAKRRSEGVQPLRLAACGTIAAYRRHLRNDQKPCAACKAAWAVAAREKRDAARTKATP